MADFFLGIDAGGTALKVAVIAADGRECGVAATTFRPSTTQPGHSERDPEAMWQALCANTRQALNLSGLSGDDIAAIGITGYGNGLYLLDAEHRPVMPGILAPDLRAATIVDEWRADGTETAQLAHTYQPSWPGRPAPLLAWLKRHHPEILAKAATLLLCKDYLRFRLTGKLANEVTDLSTAGLLPGDSRRLDPALFELLGIGDCARLMPPVIETLSVAGELTSAAAAAMGLRAGTPVAAGSCDNLAIMYGCGVVDTNRVVIISGTWGLHQSFLEKPVTDGSIVIVAHGAEAGQWLAIEGSPTSASTLEWFVDTFMRQLNEASLPTHAMEKADDQRIYALCNKALTETDPSDPPVFFLPYLNGAIDCAAARGSLIGLSSWHRFGHVVRAIYEGVAFEHRRHFGRLLAHRSKPATACFAGGAARSDAWSRIFAACLDLPLNLPRGQELGALGAAILAAYVTGRQGSIPDACRAMTGVTRTILPDPELRLLFDRRYETYKMLSAALAPHWQDLAN